MHIRKDYQINLDYNRYMCYNHHKFESSNQQNIWRESMKLIKSALFVIAVSALLSFVACKGITLSKYEVIEKNTKLIISLTRKKVIWMELQRKRSGKIVRRHKLKYSQMKNIVLSDGTTVTSRRSAAML